MATRETTRVTPSYEELEEAYRSASGRANARPRLRSSRRMVLNALERTDGSRR
jgi:hypothetical protein